MNHPKSKGFFVILIFVAIVVSVFSKPSRYKLPKEYEWVSGIWTCQTMYGPMTYCMGPDMSFSDNEGHTGTYRIEKGSINTQCTVRSASVSKWMKHVKELDRAVATG